VRIDYLGAALLGGTLLSVMFGLNQFGDGGLASPLPWSLLALGILLGASFLLEQRRAAQPILPPALLRSQAFMVINGINLVYGRPRSASSRWSPCTPSSRTA